MPSRSLTSKNAPAATSAADPDARASAATSGTMTSSGSTASRRAASGLVPLACSRSARTAPGPRRLRAIELRQRLGQPPEHRADPFDPLAEVAGALAGARGGSAIRAARPPPRRDRRGRRPRRARPGRRWRRSPARAPTRRPPSGPPSRRAATSASGRPVSVASRDANTGPRWSTISLVSSEAISSRRSRCWSRTSPKRADSALGKYATSSSRVAGSSGRSDARTAAFTDRLAPASSTASSGRVSPAPARRRASYSSGPGQRLDVGVDDARVHQLALGRLELVEVARRRVPSPSQGVGLVGGVGQDGRHDLVGRLREQRGAVRRR